ncbi:MAG: heavy metal-associated domain-containing protein, partial [Anaerolineae bacterium]
MRRAHLCEWTKRYTAMNNQQWQRRRLNVKGMDCAECALHTEEAVRGVPGVREARVFLGAERLDVVFDPGLTDTDQIARAVEGVGYRVEHEPGDVGEARASDMAERLTGLFVGVVALVVLVEIVGERLGLL